LFGYRSDAKEISDKRVVHNAMKLTSDEVKQKYDLSFAGISEEGDKDNKDKYKVVGLFFNSKRYISKSEARNLIINITELFLKNLNTEQVRPYLTVFPFTEQNISMSIIVKVPTKNWDYSQITFCGIRQGELYYTYYIPETKFGRRTEEETYADAKKLLEQESKSDTE
jgi:hypothetical protein